MSVPELTIRLLRPTDAADVTDLLIDAFAEEYEAAGRDRVSVLRAVRQDAWALTGPWRGLMSPLTGDFAVLVAELGGRIVATTTISGSRLPLISGVAVLPAFRRMGIARQLLAAAEQHAVLHGRDAVTLDVLAHNDPAVALYHEDGYETVHQYIAMEPGDLSLALPSGWRCGRVPATAVRALSALALRCLPAEALALQAAAPERYLGGPPVRLERWLTGVASYRRALMHEDQLGGFLSGKFVRGQQQARITYPLLPPAAGSALPALLVDAVRWLTRAGAASVRVDISSGRPDQQETLAAAGWRPGWTYLQLRKSLQRPATLTSQARR